jgi:hypothetical protein
MAAQNKRQRAPVPNEAASPGLQRQPPGVADADYQNKSAAYVAELAPRNVFQEHIARKIAEVTVECDALCARKNMLMWQKAVSPMYFLLTQKASLDAQRAERLALAWAQGSAEATSAIIALNIDPEVAHNEAYIGNIFLIDMIDKQIERLERRRRSLLSEYNQLQKDTRSPREGYDVPIEDAEVLDSKIKTERTNDKNCA